MRYTSSVAQKSQKPEFSPIDVFVGEDGRLVAEFGPNNYRSNVESMKQPRSNLPNHSRIDFKSATTAESLDYIAGSLTDVKRRMLDLRWIQVGRIARTSEGVYINQPTDKYENPIEDEDALRLMINGAEKTNGIRVAKSGVVFVPYEAFERGVQEAGKFVEGGLARGLEKTPGKRAKDLSAITSKYPEGVNVWGFEPANEGEVLSRVVSLGSGRGVGGYGLDVGGNGWDVNFIGFAFGVQK